MQRRRPVVAASLQNNHKKGVSTRHGRVGIFTRNMNRASKSTMRMTLFFFVVLVVGIFFVEIDVIEQSKIQKRLYGVGRKHAAGPSTIPTIPKSAQSEVKRDDAGRRFSKDVIDKDPPHMTNKVNAKAKLDSDAKSEAKAKIIPLAEKNAKTDADEDASDKLSENSTNTNPADEIQKVKKEFFQRYGGETEATAMLSRGIVSAADGSETPKALKHTAERIIQAMNGDKTFVMSFGGYSVTVGRGNHYHQSYPFIMQNVLKPIFELLGLDLVVRNSAIGGIPSFPYGWCLPNFLGDDSDVVSWDYGMNEGKDADAFEAYLRQSTATLSKRPMMILLDNKRTRVQMMKKYNQNGALLDSIAVGRKEVVSKELLDKEEKDRPVGLQKWDEWGAPKGSPGQSQWHPKMMEHELIGWMIAMHFLEAVEAALDMIDKKIVDIKEEEHEKMVLLPKPVSTVKGGGAESPSHLLFGAPIDDSDESSPWYMDTVSCRTSFLPNIRGGLLDIIVSGLAEDVGDDLKSRDDSQYSSGWVVDVGKVERDTKRKVQKVGGLGYIDMKNALYGIPASGTLKLSLPHEGPVHKDIHDKESDMLASHWFDTLVFCEVNEKRGDKECKPETDMAFVVGGVPSTSVVQITNAASYLKKSICINVGIPSDARVTVKDVDDDPVVELSIDVSVSRKDVSRAGGACSISHVVWQSH